MRGRPRSAAYVNEMRTLLFPVPGNLSQGAEHFSDNAQKPDRIVVGQAFAAFKACL
jgi:hypothetical protein